jgi:putative membrane protein
MRYLHIAIIVLLTALVLTFKVQNLQSVTVQFLSFTASMPVTALILLIYLLGMLTGGSLWSLFKRSYRGAFPASKSV